MKWPDLSISGNPENLPYPIFERISIECHSFCNRRCGFCTRTYNKRPRPIQFMPERLIRKVLHELSDFEFEGRVSFHFYNEIFTDPRILRILAYSSGLGLRNYINTNCDFLTPEVIETLSNLRVVQLNISLYDWQSDEEYQSLQEATIERLNLRSFPNEYRFIKGGDHLGTRAGYAKHKPQPDGLPLHAGCSCITKKLEIRCDGIAVMCSHDYYGIHAIGDIANQHILEIWFGEKRMRQVQALTRGDREAFELCSRCSDFITEPTNLLDERG